MRTLGVWILVATLAVAVAHGAEESVVALKARLDTAPAQDRPTICIHIAQLQLKNADRLYEEGNVEEARDAVRDIITYSEKARDAAKVSRKHLKRVEIALRKMADRLDDIKRTLAFDDQAPVQDAIQRLQDLRTSLLQEMFKKEKK